MRRFIIVMAALATLAVGLTVPAAAAATPPSRVAFDEPFTHVYPCALVEEGVFHRSFTTFYDQDGDPSRILEQVSFEGVIIDTGTGTTFLDRGHLTVEFFATGISLAGIIYTIHLPGEGIIHLDVGRLIVDSNFNTVFASAQAVDLFDKDAAICAALT